MKRRLLEKVRAIIFAVAVGVSIDVIFDVEVHFDVLSLSWNEVYILMR
ncbi:hypothetical protein FACS189483_04270 [Spirochaetia bacterium]|nr:hypothetical protein FACS189483_04270 [Spirochaetia bacterium]